MVEGVVLEVVAERRARSGAGSRFRASSQLVAASAWAGVVRLWRRNQWHKEGHEDPGVDLDSRHAMARVHVGRGEVRRRAAGCGRGGVVGVEFEVRTWLIYYLGFWFFLQQVE